MPFEANLPIYLQIMDDFKKQIILGNYKPSDKVSSVRDLALLYGVNPNTVQRALSELERIMLLRSERTSGRYITDDLKLIDELKNEFIKDRVNKFIDELMELNFTDAEIIEHVEGRIHDGNIS